MNGNYKYINRNLYLITMAVHINNKYIYIYIYVL